MNRSRLRSLSGLAAILFALALVVAVVSAYYERTDQGREATSENAVTAAVLEELITLSEKVQFDRPSGPWELSLPEDYGGHPNARSETWLVAAHLEDESGARFGVTFSLSRFGLRSEAPGPDNLPWDLLALYRAHVTLVSDDDAAARGEERFSRGAGVAGHDRETKEVWLDHWQLSYGEQPDGNGLALSTTLDGEPIELALHPAKSARITGVGDNTPLRGFAVPRMEVVGRVGRGEGESSVTGHAWMDRLWGELPMPGGPLSYDRLILQLSDGTDLTLLRSQRRDSRGVTTVDGFVVDANDEVRTLSEEQIEISTVRNWTSERGGTTYPIGWQINGMGLELLVEPIVDDQMHDFALPGWTGLVTVSGKNGAAIVTGLGTLQLSGYDDL